MVVRLTRASMSAASGCGSWLRSQTDPTNRGRKQMPVAQGIQNWSIWKVDISQRPMSLTAPLATMYAQLRPASSISDVRRPSRYSTTSPQTMPSGSPLKKMATTLRLLGKIAKSSRDNSATTIIHTRPRARFWRSISAQTLIPMTFESA